MPLRARLVHMAPHATWKHVTQLAIPPFVGLGIRLDTYDMVNVESVLVGDAGVDVTCIVRLEGLAPSPEKLESLGFEIGPYP